MALWIPDAAEEIFLDLILAVNYTLRLYKTVDVTAGKTDSQISALTSADFTEATFTGYSAKALTGGSWTSTQGDPSTGTYSQQTFTSTANQTAQTIYGYYIVRTSDNKLMWHERFTGPLVISLNGDTIQMTPTITLEDDQEATVAARGLMASQVLTTNDSVQSSGTSTDMLLNNFDADGTRNYKICSASTIVMIGTGSWLTVLSIDGVNFCRLWQGTTASGTTFDYMSGSMPWQPVTGTYDLLISFQGPFSGTSTAQLTGNSAVPRALWIEDIGPR